MANDVTITLRAADGATTVFKQVGREAQNMGKTIDSSAKSSEGALDRLNKKGLTLGAAFTALTGTLALAARANAEAEASQARLETAIDNTGHSLFEYQDSLDAASKKALQLGFDDEDAADAIAKLTTATGDANTAIKDLSLAEDIARARKIDLAAATQIVIAAEQGRVGALARIGVQVDANASKEERMAALEAQFAGNAEAYSKTSAAGFDRLKNSAENALEAIGAHLGPAQQLLMIMPGLSAGFSGVGAAVGALLPEMTAATAGATLLNLALGPVGIAALAITAGFGIFELSRHMRDDLRPAADAAKVGLEAINQTLKDFVQIQSVDVPLVSALADTFTYLTSQSADYEAGLKSLVDTQKKAQEQYDLYIKSFPTGDPRIADQKRLVDNATDAINKYNVAQGQHAIADKKVGEAEDAANKILHDTSVAGDESRTELQRLTDQVNRGAITWPDYLNGVIGVAAIMEPMAAGMAKAGDTTADTTKELLSGTNALTGYKMGIAVLGDEYTNLDGSVGKANTALEESASDHDKVQAAIDSVNAKLKAETDAFLKNAEAVAGLDTFLAKLAHTHQATASIIAANDLTNSTAALGSAMTVIIDGTKSLASQSGNLNDWAIDLINVAGSYGKIDDLLNSGQISLTTYNQAQQAQVDITAANADIQEDVLRIQTKQAPLLADLEQKQAAYIDTLADLPATQQLVQLGWMDQAESLKAQNALQLAAAASAGDLGEAGKKAAESAISAAAQADPILESMLEDMGLISVGADGTITLNFPEAETVQEAVDGLTASIDVLIETLGGVPPNVHSTVTVDSANASAQAQHIKDQLDALNGYTANTYVVIHGYSTGPTMGITPGNQAHGGMIGHAQHGAALNGWSWVGEAGPELIRAPGAMVLPATASAEATRGRGGGITINGPITVIANDARQFADSMRAHTYGSAR